MRLKIRKVRFTVQRREGARWFEVCDRHRTAKEASECAAFVARDLRVQTRVMRAVRDFDMGQGWH